MLRFRHAIQTSLKEANVFPGRQSDIEGWANRAWGFPASSLDVASGCNTAQPNCLRLKAILRQLCAMQADQIGDGQEEATYPVNDRIRFGLKGDQTGSLKARPTLQGSSESEFRVPRSVPARDPPHERR